MTEGSFSLSSRDPDRRRDIAHIGPVELFTPRLQETTAFFVELMGLREVHAEPGVRHVHAWDDYQSFTVRIIERNTAGVGRTYLRAASPAALDRLRNDLTDAGVEVQSKPGPPGIGLVYEFDDTDGHPMGLYWEVDWYQPDPADRPSLKNQAGAFPGRGANVRRLDHINYLANDVTAISALLSDQLGGRMTERIAKDDGTSAAIWYTFTNKSYDLVYTEDWTGASGRLHHLAFATDTREDILRAADVFLEAGTHIETGPHKHAIQQTFFLYVWEPGGNRIELCNAGARLILAPDWETISWTAAERAKGQAWGLKTIESFHTYGTPPAE